MCYLFHMDAARNKSLYSLKKGFLLSLCLFFFWVLSGCGDSGPDERRVHGEKEVSLPDSGELKGEESIEEWLSVELFNKGMLLECNDSDLLRRISPLIEAGLKTYIDAFLHWEIRRQLDHPAENAGRKEAKPYLVSFQRLSSPGSRPLRLEVAVESQSLDLEVLDPLTVEIAGNRTIPENTDFTPVLSAVLELMCSDMLRSGLDYNQIRHVYTIYKKAAQDSWERRAIKRGIDSYSRTPLENQYLEFYIESLSGDDVYASVVKYKVPDYLKTNLQRMVSLLAKGGMMKSSPAGLFLQIVFDRVIIKLEDTEFSRVIHGQYNPGTVEGRMIMGNEVTGESQILSQVGKQKLPGAVSNSRLSPQEEAFRVTERIIYEKMLRDWVLQCFENSLSNETVHLVPLLLDMCDGPLLNREEKERIARLLRRVQRLEKGNSYLILGLKTIGINRKHKMSEVYNLIGKEAVSIWMDLYRIWPGNRAEALSRIINMKRNGSLDTWTGLNPFSEEIAAGVVEMTGSLRRTAATKVEYRDSDWLKKALLFLYLCDHRGDEEYVQAVRFLQDIGYEASDSEIGKLYHRTLSDPD